MLFFRDKKKELKAEIARLEAFLSAMPGAYCGWSAQSEIAYSPRFANMLGIEQIKDEYDVYNALTPTDAAALEGHFTALRHKGTDFIFEAETKKKDKILRFNGKRGRNLAMDVSYDILSVEDITNLVTDKREIEEARLHAEDNEALLKTVLDTLPLPVWFADNHGKLIWVNRYYAESIRSTRERVLDEQVYMHFGSSKSRRGKKRMDAIAQMSEKSITTGEIQSQETHAVIHSKRKLLRVVVTPVEGKNRTVGMAKDITRQEEVEIDFRHFIENTQALLNQMQAAIVSFTSDMRVEYYNPIFTRLWDLQASWLDQKPKLSEIMERLRENRRLPDQADFRAFRQSWEKKFTDLMESEEELMYLPDGTTLRIVFIPRPYGGLIMTFEDVTSSLELESKYKTLSEAQKMSFDSLTEGIAVFGSDGRLKLYNPSYSKIWQIHPEDLDGEPHITKLIEKKKSKFNAEDWENTKRLLMRFALERSSQDETIKLKDGSTISGYTVPLPDGGIMITFEDITAQIQVETALREKAIALEEAEKLKLDFLANVSYQLRTPLNAIMGFAEILTNQYFGTLNDRQNEYAQGITDAGTRLLNLIDAILDLSTIEAGYFEIHPDTIHVRSMLDNLYNLTQEWARKEGIRVELKCPKTIGEFIGDERRLKQALIGLVRNAIQFSPEDGKIIISAKRNKDKFIEISVTDEGPGIAAEEQKRIFDPFAKATQTGQNDGVGLGLALVKNIIELHGGSIALDSDLKKGTVVTLLVPPEIEEKKADKAGNKDKEEKKQSA